jgi:hypothetical protein
MGSDGKFYCLDMGGNIKWEFTPNGAVQSSPAYEGGIVFFTTNVRNGTIYCLHSWDGKLIWQYTPWPESYIISSPAVSNTMLYVASDNGRLYCFDRESEYMGFVRDHTTETLNLGEYARFIHRYREYIMRIISMNATSASIKIDSMEETIEVPLNEVELIDANGDGEKDLAILLNDVNLTSGEATITLYRYNEPEEIGINMVAVYVLALFMIGLVVMVIIILVARRVAKKTGAPKSGKRKKKDGS